MLARGGLGLGTLARARTHLPGKDFLVLDWYQLLLLYTLPVRKKAMYEVMYIVTQCRQYHLHGTAIAPSTPEAAALPEVPIPLVVDFPPPFSS